MLKTRLSDLTQCGIPAFNFAGIHFPKHVWTLPQGALPSRLSKRKSSCCGDYYHAPKPISGTHPGQGFYLDSDGMPNLRWRWADDVVNLKHTGWFTDEFGDSDKVRGFVMRLPKGRGFLAGWSMGEHMASAVEGYIYADEDSAAWAADSIAESVAEDQREYGEEQWKLQESED